MSGKGILYQHSLPASGRDGRGGYRAGLLSDLHLDEIVAAVIASQADDGIDKFFYAPLRDPSSVEYRHQVFRDLEHDRTRRPIRSFVDGYADDATPSRSRRACVVSPATARLVSLCGPNLLRRRGTGT